MNRDELLYFMDEDVDSFCRLVSAVGCVSPTYWQTEYLNDFGPGGVPVHLVQGGKFTLRFIREQIGLDPPTELESFFREAADDYAVLSRMNLESARRQLGIYRDVMDYTESVLEDLASIRSRFEEIPGHLYRHPVSHPLVRMQASAGFVLTQMFTRHWPYHFGQANLGLRRDGHHDKVVSLEQFGTFGPARPLLTPDTYFRR